MKYVIIMEESVPKTAEYAFHFKEIIELGKTGSLRDLKVEKDPSYIDDLRQSLQGDELMTIMRRKLTSCNVTLRDTLPPEAPADKVL